jgi:hypothetical protein
LGRYLKMNPKNRAERVVALSAIENEAQKLANEGADGIEIKSFTIGARKKLAEERPDVENYFDAAVAAKKAKNKF